VNIIEVVACAGKARTNRELTNIVGADVEINVFEYWFGLGRPALT